MVCFVLNDHAVAYCCCLLELYGDVKPTQFEKSKCPDFEIVCIGTGAVVMTGDRLRVPHLFNVTNPVPSDKYELRVTPA